MTRKAKGDVHRQPSLTESNISPNYRLGCATGMPKIEAEVDSDRRSLLLTGAATIASLSLPASAIADAMDEHKGDTMNQLKSDSTARAGTVTAPRYYDRIDYKRDDVAYKQKNYTYMSAKGPVVGLVSSLICTIDAPAKDVWPYLKDFNSFEGPFGIRYTGERDQLVVWGDLYTSEEHDLGQETLQYGGTKNTWKSVPSRVLRVIPEHLLVLFEEIPADGSSDGMSPGFHTITLNEHVGVSHISMMLEHGERLKYETEEEALDNSRWGPNKYDYSRSLSLWKDNFVPTLKALVAGTYKK